MGPISPFSGILQLPLQTPTLPPAEHTNAYFLGHERRIVVDAAPYDEDERARLLVECRAGAPVSMLFLTHHHSDHMGAASWLAEELGVPIAGHEITRDLLSGFVDVTVLYDEGDTIDLGLDAEGRPLSLEVLFTPGHAPGHLCLRDRRARTMVVGDMVASIGTIIIDPPEGDMARYLEELARLRDLGPHTLLPAHGRPIEDGVAKFGEYIAHRLAREAKVVAALEGQREATPEALLPVAYAGTPEFLFPLAARSCLAHLEKLVKDGRAIERGGRFTAA